MDNNLLRLTESIKDPGPRAVSFVERAYLFAKKYYLEWFENGEIILARAVEAAELVGSWELGALALSTTLLSDLPISKDAVGSTLEEELGTRLKTLVERVRTLSLITFETKNPQSIDSFSAFFLATAKDLRVLVASIARHLVRLRYANELQASEGKQLAHQSMKLFLPLAERLGMYDTARELEDRSFAILHPRIYTALYEFVSLQETREADAVRDFQILLKRKLQEDGIQNPVIEGRIKTIYSIYKNTRERRRRRASQGHDIHTFRVIVQTTSDCYHALGIIHREYSPIADRLKDFIALPKPDGYQSLHTTILTPEGVAVEIQIRTAVMDQRAHSGLHHLYKNKKRTGVLRWFPVFFPPPSHDNEVTTAATQKVPKWIKEVAEPGAYVLPSEDENEQRVSEFLKSQIFVFDSYGRVLKLKTNSTVAEYLKRSKIQSNRLISLAIENATATTETVLKNGDIIEILTL